MMFPLELRTMGDAMTSTWSRPGTEAVAQHLIDLETAALHRWGHGDPDGFLEISAPDVTYFDPFIEHGSTAVTGWRPTTKDCAGRCASTTSRWWSRGSLWGRTSRCSASVFGPRAGTTRIAGTAPRSTGTIPRGGGSCRRTGPGCSRTRRADAFQVGAGTCRPAGHARSDVPLKDTGEQGGASAAST